MWAKNKGTKHLDKIIWREKERNITTIIIKKSILYYVIEKFITKTEREKKSIPEVEKL